MAAGSDAGLAALETTLATYYTMIGVAKIGPGSPGLFRFVGFRVSHDGQNIFLDQEGYIKLQRFGLDQANPCKTPGEPTSQQWEAKDVEGKIKQMQKHNEREKESVKSTSAASSGCPPAHASTSVIRCRERRVW